MPLYNFTTVYYTKVSMNVDQPLRRLRRNWSSNLLHCQNKYKIIISVEYLDNIIQAILHRVLLRGNFPYKVTHFMYHYILISVFLMT